jgi:hypothetical protein
MANDLSGTVRLPAGDESAAPVTILDARGNVVGVVSAAEFRRIHPRLAITPLATRRRRRD